MPLCSMTRRRARVASPMLAILGALALGRAGTAAAQPGAPPPGEPPAGDVQDPYAGEPEDPYGAPSEAPPPKPAPATPPARPPEKPATPAPAKPATPAPSPATPAPTPEAPAPSPEQAIDEAVARALYERARFLADAGDYASARMLLQESLSRSPDGPAAGDARALLAVCEENLGELPGAGDPDATLDPFASREHQDTVDPYADDPGAVVLPELDPEAGARARLSRDRQAGQRTLAIYGGLYGFTAGMAVAGYDDGDAPLLAGLLGAGAGVGGAYLLDRGGRVSAGQASAIAWSGGFAAMTGGILVDLSGIGTSTADGVTRGAAVGGLLGTGAGWLLGRQLDPTAGDVALVSSLGLYGTAASLMLAVGLAPVEVEGYSLNALLGAGVGLGVGLYAAPRLTVSRGRMLRVDLGALLGGLAPWLLYPTIEDSSTTAEEQTLGVLSAIGVLGGAYLAWRLTADMDAIEPVAQKSLPAMTGLLQHTADGEWALGVPMPRLPDSTLGPRSRGFGMAVDLVSGQF